MLISPTNAAEISSHQGPGEMRGATRATLAAVIPINKMKQTASAFRQ